MFSACLSVVDPWKLIAYPAGSGMGIRERRVFKGVLVAGKAGVCPWEMSQQLQTPRRGKAERADRATARTCPPPSGLGARQPGRHGEGPGRPVPPSESSAGAEPAEGQPRL